MADADDMEVVITMCPTEANGSAKQRKFVLNKDKPLIHVGRASRNPERGLQPAEDNATFDCPIMSRLHAKFTASPNFKVVNVKDLGSTHGTFLSGRRVSGECVLKSGEIVTFGVRVTNGPLVYSAQAFRVDCKWQPRVTALHPSRAGSMDPITSAISPASYEISDDSLQASRDASVQVIDSNIRTSTYSVPSNFSSDSEEMSDDDLEISSPVRTGNHSSSALTTPEQPHYDEVRAESKAVNAQELPVHIVSAKTIFQGASQTDPIDIEGKSDEISLNGPILSRSPGYGLPPTTLQGLTAMKPLEDVISANVESEDDEGPEVLPIQSQKKRSDIIDLLNDKPLPATKAPLENLFGLGHPKPEPLPKEHQIEQIIRETQRRVDKHGEVNQIDCPVLTNSTPSASVARPPKVFQDEADDNDEFPFDFYDSPADTDYENMLYVPTPGSIKGYVRQSDDISPLLPSYNPMNTERAPSPSDAAMARSSSNNTSRFAHTVGKDTRVNNEILPDIYDTPFSRSAVPCPARDYYNCYPSEPAQVGSKYISGPFAAALPAEPLYNTCKMPHPFAVGTGTGTDSPFCSPVAGPSAGSSSSRLNISNLVNTAIPHTEGRHALKRKAAEISEDAVMEALPTGHDSSSHDVALPDAQPHSLYIDHGATISQNESIRPGSGSGSGLGSGSGSSSEESAATVHSLPAKGPPHKKAKTASRSTGGMAKFVTGVVVGVVGVVTAFIATIPASVHEEVRRELS